MSSGIDFGYCNKKRQLSTEDTVQFALLPEEHLPCGDLPAKIDNVNVQFALEEDQSSDSNKKITQELFSISKNLLEITESVSKSHDSTQEIVSINQKLSEINFKLQSQIDMETKEFSTKPPWENKVKFFDDSHFC